MREIDPELGVRRRHSAHGEGGMTAVSIKGADDHVVARKSVDAADLFRQGFGTVRKGPDLR